MLTRRHLLLPVAALLLLAATGCSPAPAPATVGLQRDGAGYAVVVPLCPKGQVVTVSVYDTTDRAADWSISSDGTHGTLDRFPLFTTPPGWTAYHSGLTALKPDTKYHTAFTALGNTKNSEFTFTLTDLHTLKDGEVLTLTDDGTTTLPADKFRTAALKLC
ncbi:hypothetical protein [Streptomyces sp. NRRL WC-3742]|uniref:hypothetical protein n=1 Tax=Streptomyces sp. NRRL WC-3742 TaxID=1463934 RepID=UPI0004C8E76B|nr:hypothetical protein [Streptomyces sp. NRRL WC-3742]